MTKEQIAERAADVKEYNFQVANHHSLLRQREELARRKRNRRQELSDYVNRVIAYGPALSQAQQLALCELIGGLSEKVQEELAPELIQLLTLKPHPLAVVSLQNKLIRMEARARFGAMMAMQEKEQRPRDNKALWNPYAGR